MKDPGTGKGEEAGPSGSLREPSALIALIQQPERGKGLPYWSNLHEALAAFLETVLGPMRAPDEKKYMEMCVRDFLTTAPGLWLAEACHGVPPAALAAHPKDGSQSIPSPTPEKGEV